MTLRVFWVLQTPRLLQSLVETGAREAEKAREKAAEELAAVRVVSARELSNICFVLSSSSFFPS
jgi:hypothetical protein